MFLHHRTRMQKKDADGCTPLDHYTAAVDNNNDDEDEMTSLLRMIMLKGTRSKRNTVGQQDNSILVYPAWRNVHAVTPIIPSHEGGYRKSLIFYPLRAFKGL